MWCKEQSQKECYDSLLNGLKIKYNIILNKIISNVHQCHYM